MSYTLNRNEADKILVHICCSVDSHYFLSELRKIYPQSEILGFFYNPNIHPKSEYDLRLRDVERSCAMLGIQLVEGEYNDEQWYRHVRGLENEPEKGERCIKCFDMRLEKSAQIAQEMAILYFTSTLLSSPLKEQGILFAEGDLIAQKYGLNFVKIDVRSNGGTQAQNALANRDNLYRQTYCGCQFALLKQRDSQKQIALELMSNIGKQIAPGSNEQRMAVFALRDKYEREGKKYALYKQPKIIWRNLRSLCLDGDHVINSYVLTHSRSKNMIKTSTISYIPQHIEDKEHKPVRIFVGYARRDESIFLSIESINKLLKIHYKDTQEMLYNPPSFEAEIALRVALCGADSINPIIVLDSEVQHSLKVYIDAHFQESSIFAIAVYS